MRAVLSAPGAYPMVGVMGSPGDAGKADVFSILCEDDGAAEMSVRPGMKSEQACEKFSL